MWGFITIMLRNKFELINFIISPKKRNLVLELTSISIYINRSQMYWMSQRGQEDQRSFGLDRGLERGMLGCYCWIWWCKSMETVAECVRQQAVNFRSCFWEAYGFESYKKTWRFLATVVLSIYVPSYQLTLKRCWSGNEADPKLCTKEHLANIRC